MKLQEILGDRSDRAFTLIEVLITVALLLLIAAGGIRIYGNLYSASKLDVTAAELLQMLRLTRVRSESGFRDASHGVFIEEHAYTLYQGTSWIARDAQYDQQFVLDASFSLSTDFLLGDIHFAKGTGYLATGGYVTILHTASGEKVKISIYALGTFSLE